MTAKNIHSSKKALGQFYTTNHDYILQGLHIPKDTKIVIEPFVGNGDLLGFVKDSHTFLELYDIEPKNGSPHKVTTRDTILNPPSYSGKFLLTNPPYLAKNKSKNKDTFKNRPFDDVYKCFIEELLTNSPDGGIIIIPLNFWSSTRKNDVHLRKSFINVFHVLRVNVFEERVFDDTSYSVCSIQFEKRDTDCTLTHDLNFYIFPSKITMTIQLSESSNYTIGGELYSLPQNSSLSVDRLTKKNKNSDGVSNILLKCIDDNSKNRIGMSIVSDDERHIDTTENFTARSYATLVILPPLNMSTQKKLVESFNTFLNEKRTQYNSLFLTNFRESSDIARKRISFNLAYEIVNYILSDGM